MKKITDAIEYKLCTLLAYLGHTTIELNSVANELQDVDLKMAILEVATETNQLTNELNAQLKCLGINYLMPSVKFEANEISEYVSSISPFEGKKEGFAICGRSIYFIIAAYKDVLKENIPYPFLKEFIQHQLKGIKSAFSQILLLDLVKN